MSVDRRRSGGSERMNVPSTRRFERVDASRAPEHRPAETSRSVARLCVFVVGAALAACQSNDATQGRKRDVLASYQFRTLKASLGPEVQVLTVKAAAEQTLRSRGYVVTSESGSGDKARVVAKNNGSGDWQRVVVESWVGGGGGGGASPFTGVSVTCEPWGDERVSRAVLDGVLGRLGR